jgi:hypothetical protein
MNKGKDLTEVRSPQRQLAPDTSFKLQGNVTKMVIAKENKKHKHNGKKTAT